MAALWRRPCVYAGVVLVLLTTCVNGEQFCHVLFPYFSTFLDPRLDRRTDNWFLTPSQPRRSYQGEQKKKKKKKQKKKKKKKKV